MQERLQKILRKKGLPLYGVCDFASLLPLLPCRAAARLPQNAKSVVVVAFPYKTPTEPQNISRYATVPDYHAVCGEILAALATQLQAEFGGSWAPFVDNSPIPEVKAAVLAGLGVRGKNGLLITLDYGSYVFLGELVTDVDLPVATPRRSSCMQCGACTTACPSGCIGGEKSACLSAVTQQKAPLTPKQETQIRQSGCIWGCDICQKVCPHNLVAENTFLEPFLQDVRPAWHLGDPIEGRAFAWRGEGVISRNAKLLEK